MSRENLFNKDERIFALVISSFILITFSRDYVLVLLEEN